MEIPYYVLGIIYLIALLIFFGFAFVNVYHMVRFGFFDFTGRMHTLLMACVVAVVLFFTILFLKDVAWTENFSVFNMDFEELSFDI